VLFGTDGTVERSVTNYWQYPMPSADEIRTKAQELYDQADRIEDAHERLPVILRAIECEMEADALERDDATVPPPEVITERTGGGDSESA